MRRRDWLIALMCMLSSCSSIDVSNQVIDGAYKDENSELSRPNILLIVVDDLAYSDMGVFGGEIGTPNMDSLATAGIQLTNFYTAPTCSPTRAMLLSGTDNHLAGTGNMHELMAANQKGKPGYEGYLNFDVVTLPQLLLDADYHTYMVGKWHLGHEERTSPAARGFEKSFSLDEGGAGHFDDLPIIGPKRVTYRENGKKTSWPEGRYSTEFYTEKIIDYIKGDQSDDEPFFAYIAYTAPHFPLQAPASSIAEYRGTYDQGYEVLAQQRFARMKELGLIPEGVAQQSNWETRWYSLSEQQKKEASRKMEIYAAMVSDLDQYIGVLIDFLKESGKFDNTLILLMSDNGAEGHNFPAGSQVGDWAAACCDNSYENMGNPDSFVWYGSSWAQAGTVPFLKYKGHTAEGGIRAPAVLHYPEFDLSGVRFSGLTTVLDIMPTILELAGVKHPGKTYEEREVHPLRGYSMLGVLHGESLEVHPEEHYIGWEFVGRRAIRQGDWKLHWRRNENGGSWQLFNLRLDPAERHDRFDQEEQIASDLLELWERYSRETGIILPDQRSVY